MTQLCAKMIEQFPMWEVVYRILAKSSNFLEISTEQSVASTIWQTNWRCRVHLPLAVVLLRGRIYWTLFIYSKLLLYCFVLFCFVLFCFVFLFRFVFFFIVFLRFLFVLFYLSLFVCLFVCFVCFLFCFVLFLTPQSIQLCFTLTAVLLQKEWKRYGVFQLHSQVEISQDQTPTDLPRHWDCDGLHWCGNKPQFLQAQYNGQMVQMIIYVICNKTLNRGLWKATKDDVSCLSLVLLFSHGVVHNILRKSEVANFNLKI